MIRSDYDLIRQTLVGDDTAFGFLVDKYKGAVHALAYRKLGDFHLAEDITQDTFLKAYQNLSSLRDWSRFPGWLYVIATRGCISWQRRKRLISKPIEDVSDELQSASRARYAEDKEHESLHDVLGELPESERTVLTLHYLAGMSCEEIGEFIGTSRGAVKDRLYRARLHLREEMDTMFANTWGMFQLSHTLTQQVMEKIRIAPPTPVALNRPPAPWLAAITIGIAALLVGLGNRSLPWFQPPYNLDGSESNQRAAVTEAPFIEMPITIRMVEGTDQTGAANQMDEELGPNAPQTVGNASNSLADMADGEWVQTNGPYGGDVHALFISLDGTLLAGTQGGGIFQSNVGGSVWIRSNRGLTYSEGHGYVTVFEFARKGDTIYAATGGGLFASEDIGHSWQRLTHSKRSKGLATTAVAVLGDTLYIGSSDNGVWYSRDGTTWESISDGLGNLKIRELATMNTTLFAGTHDGAFRLRTGEHNWTPINRGLAYQSINIAAINESMASSGMEPLSPDRLPSGVRVDSFAVLGNTLYMGAYMGQDKGLFRSEDEGDTWEHITSNLMKHTVEALAVSDQALYASTFGGGVFRSTNRGNSWVAMSDGLTDRVVAALLATPEDVLYAGTMGGGVFCSTNADGRWEASNHGLANTSVDSLVVLEGTLYAKTEHEVLRSVDGGGSWRPAVEVSSTGPHEVKALQVANGRLYAAAISFPTQHAAIGGIYALDESGHWTEVGIDPRLNRIRAFTVDSDGYYAGTSGDGIFYWASNRDAWTFLGLEGHIIEVLAVLNGTLHAGTGRGQVFRLQHDGLMWETAYAGPGGHTVSGLAWVDGTLYLSTWEGVFRSDDGVNTWAPLDTGLSDLTVTVLVTDARTLYAGTYYSGIFRLEHGGHTWEPVGNMQRNIRSITLDEKVLYAGSENEGVFRIALDGSGITDDRIEERRW